MLSAKRLVLLLLCTLGMGASLVLTPLKAHALTDDEVKCRATIAKSLGKYLKAGTKALAKCHKLRDGGKIPPSTNCNNFATFNGYAHNKVSDAGIDAQLAASAACSAAPSVLSQFPHCPAPWQFTDDGGATTGIDDFLEAAFCVASHGASVLENAGLRSLGHSGATLTKEEQKCHGTIAKSVGKVITAVVKERAKCQGALDKAGGPLSFACSNLDPDGKIASAISKAHGSVADACSGSVNLGHLDSCAVSVSGLVACVLDSTAKTAGSGMAAAMWELPGVCPTSGSYQVETNISSTDLDVGWRGLVHDMDPILGYSGARLSISCDADCASCSTVSVDPPANACRCAGDNSVVCSTNGDCAGPGAPCTCFYNPPAPYSAGGSPVCVTTKIDGPMSGTLDPGTENLTLNVPTRNTIFVGGSQGQPCPECIAGLCSGGARNGLGCSVDANDATFGPVSFDCPPSLPSNITGAGVTTTIHYSTGFGSLPFNLACDFPVASLMCACSTCSLDNSRACNSDAECGGAGVCRVDGGHGGEPRKPNNCDDFICSPDPSGAPNEGKCLAGPSDTYCSGFLRANGDGIITCANNTDCDALDPECPGNDCGTCTLLRTNDCFLDPIVAQGEPGHTVAGNGCISRTSNAGVNGAIGWPGPYRVKQNVATELFCSDGITPFEPPGGSNCP